MENVTTIFQEHKVQGVIYIYIFFKFLCVFSLIRPPFLCSQNFLYLILLFATTDTHILFFIKSNQGNEIGNWFKEKLM